MDIEQLAAAVKKAELEASERRDRARGAYKQLKADAKAAATPWRIVSVGVVTGFLVGRSQPGPAGQGVGSRLFGSIAQALITTMGASATAGAAASTAADAAAAATVDATVPPHPSDARVEASEVGPALMARADASRATKAAAATGAATAADDEIELPPVAPEPALFAHSDERD
jgi:hypothetical protein